MKYLIALSLQLLAVLQLASAQTTSINILHYKSPQTLHLEAGKIFSFFIPLQKGQFASIKVHQATVGVGYAVYTPTDSLIAVEDNNALYQTEIINIAATQSGKYKVEVFWDYGRPQSGEFSIVWDKQESLGVTPALRAEQFMNSWYGNDGPGAAITILKKGKVIFQSYKGLANLEYKIPITRNSTFELASCSKQFTGLAIAKLIDAGKISLGDDIRKYLPEMPDYGKIITIENLIYHTSGLRNWDALSNSMGFRPEDVLTTDMLYRMICNTSRLNFDPGEKFSYTNTGYNLLAMIVERATHQRFDTWMAENIFKPIGMKNTTNKDDVMKVIPKKVNSYKKGPDGYRLNTDALSMVGSSSVYSSMDDLIVWVNYLGRLNTKDSKLNDLLRRKTTLANGEKIEFYSFGNGFGERKGVENIEHLGLTSGFRAAISRYPDQDIAVIFLANDNNDASYIRCWTVTDLFLNITKNKALEPFSFPELKEALANTASLTEKCPVDTKQYEGIYYSEETNSHYKISNQKGVLTAISFRFDVFELKWSQTDSFSTNMNSFERKITFHRNKENVITGFTLSGIDRDVEFKRLGI